MEAVHSISDHDAANTLDDVINDVENGSVISEADLREELDAI